MKDPALAIRTAYFNALSGNVTVAGYTFPVYDTREPNDTKSQGYIVLTEQNLSTTMGTKADFLTDNAILIEVVTLSSGVLAGGFRTADLAATEILKIVNPSDKNDRIDFGTEFQNVFPEIISINNLREATDTQEIFRKLIRVRNVVHQR